MKRLATAALGAILLVGGLTGCGEDVVAGEVVAKEYELRNCEMYRKGKCKLWDPAEHELTVRRSDNGVEVELVVSKSTYNGAEVGEVGTWKGVID